LTPLLTPLPEVIPDSKGQPLKQGTMKPYLLTAGLAALFLLLGAGMIQLLSRPPQGKPILLIPPPTPLPLKVEVSGAVLLPGVYELTPGSRSGDAIEAAGGFLPEADSGPINLASPLIDGMKISVPLLKSEDQTTESPPDERSQTVIIPEAPTSTGGLININTAIQAELETLPRIGPVTAEKIITYREANGPFQTVDELLDVSGIGPATLEAIRGFITTGQ
jgi:competence protein ComEA